MTTERTIHERERMVVGAARWVRDAFDGVYEWDSADFTEARMEAIRDLIHMVDALDEAESK